MTEQRNPQGSSGRRAWARGLRSLALSTAILCSVLAFQNCTSPAESTTDNSVTTEAAKLDFAYDATLDEIAHMECPALLASNSDPAFFTFRAGAFFSGGVMLTPAYFDAMKSNNEADQISILSSSQVNTSTLMQLAVRSRSNYQQVGTSSGTATAGADFVNIFAEMGTPDLAQALIELPQNSRLKYVTDVGDTRGSRMEGNLNFDSTKLTDIRNHLNTTTAGDEFLALTFTGDGDTSIAARSPATYFPADGITAAKNVYGKGYRFTFTKPSVTGLYSGFPMSALETVTESNLVSPTDRTNIGTWSCSNKYQFRIVREEDVTTASAPGKAGATDCVKAPDPANSTNSSDWKIVRAILRQENYYIDMDHHCAIPKNGSTACYGTKAPTYVPGDQCDLLGSTSAACAAYVSICVRQ